METNQVEKLKKLLSSHNVDTSNSHGWSLLMLAAYENHLEVCRLLLEKKAAVDKQNNKGSTALFLAVQENHIDICRLLLEKKAAINKQNNYGFTPLYVAAQEGNLAVCKLLLEKKAAIDKQNNAGCTALFKAAQEGHVEVCKFLIDKKASIDKPESNGCTPLFIAAQRGRLEICQLLLDHKAGVDRHRNTGATALIIAAEECHFEICKLLIERKATIDKQNKNGCTALYKAAQQGHLDICKLLLKKKAAIDKQTNDGWTPLTIAAKQGHLEVSRYLCLKQARINHHTKRGFTALQISVEHARFDVCKFLLDNGGDVNNVNFSGISVLDTANKTDNQRIISLVKDYAEPKRATSDIGKTEEESQIDVLMRTRSVIETKINEIEEGIKRIKQLNQNINEEESNKERLRRDIEFLMHQVNERSDQITSFTTKSKTRTLLEKQNKEGGERVTEIYDEMSVADDNIKRCQDEIAIIEEQNKSFEQLKVEREELNRCLKEGNYEEMMKELNRECPICFGEMIPPLKIYQCVEGHLLCENCFSIIRDSTKVCPFCKTDVATHPIRNRALEGIIESELKSEQKRQIKSP